MQQLEISKDTQISLLSAEKEWYRSRVLALLEMDSRNQLLIDELQASIERMKTESE